MTTVRDVMTRNVISASMSMPVHEAARVLARRHITGMPVCDEQEHLVGVVSEYDLIAHPNAKSVGDVMTRDVISVMEDTSLDEVRFLLVNRKIRRLPVLSGQKVVGIVSRADLVRDLALTWVCQVCGDHERGANPPPACSKCGVPAGHEPTSAPPVGEGAAVGSSACPTCGQALPT